MVGGAIIVSGCGRRFPTFRYRMTVEVETPQGLRTGASVIQVSSIEGGSGAMYGFSSTVRGEAVAVDLPGGRTLFALLQSSSGDVDAAAGYAFAGFPPAVKRVGADAYADNLAEMLARRDVGVIPMPTAEDEVPVSGRMAKAFYPLLVSFTDIADPKSVTRVNPRDLAASFGPGIKLRRITVQITDDPVTTGIEKRLGWWEAYRNRHFDGTSTASEDLTTNAPSASLSTGSFSTEFNK
jgi:hypothetical protein